HEVRILAEELLGAAVAWIAREIEHRAQCHGCASNTSFPRRHRIDLLHELRVPGTRQRRWNREHSRPPSQVPMRRLFMKQRRDPQSGLFEKEMLNRVDERDGLFHRAIRVLLKTSGSATIRRPGHLANAVRYHLARFLW